MNSNRHEHAPSALLSTLPNGESTARGVMVTHTIHTICTFLADQVSQGARGVWAITMYVEYMQ